MAVWSFGGALSTDSTNFDTIGAADAGQMKSCANFVCDHAPCTEV